MKIISAKIYNEEKKIILSFENDKELNSEELSSLEQIWRRKLKADSSVNLEININVFDINLGAVESCPEDAPLPEEVPFFEEAPTEVVEIPFSIEQYEEAQRESIRQAAQNMKNSGGGGYGGGTYQRKNGGEYTNKGDGKYSKKKKLTPDEGEELKKDSKGNTIYMGREIDSVISKMSDIDADSGFVAVSGKIFKYEDKQIPSGSYIAMLEMTDNTYSVVAKFFFDEFDLKFVKSTFKEGKYITVYGQASQDKFTKELTIMARSISEYKPVFRKDNASVKRVELHLHTNMSAQDGLTRPSDLVKQLANWGHDAVAITDHGTAQAYPDMFNSMKNVSGRGNPDVLKLIYGCECYLCDRTPEMTNEQAKKLPTWHCIILVKNLVGLKNLYKLISLSNLNYYHKRPRMPRFEIEAHREGLIIGSACSEGELFDAVLHGESEERLLQIASFYDYLEIQPLENDMYLVRNGEVESLDAVKAINNKIVELGDKLGKMTVATCDVHFLNPEDAIYRTVLQAAQGFSDADTQPPLYLRTTEEMLAEFDYLGERAYEVVVENTRKISDEIEVIRPVPDGFYPPVIEGSDETLRTSCYEKARSIYGENLPELVEARLEKELNSIISNGYSIMYITAKELVAESARNGYQVGSRGSVGSSVAAFMAGITEVNSLPAHYRCTKCGYYEFHENEGYDCGFDMPEKNCPNCGAVLTRDGYDIPFETFLGFKGDKVPDIDLNFASEDQANAHKYTEVLFGKGKVFRAGTIAGLADKSARGYVIKYLQERGKQVSNAEINRLASGFEGVRKTTGQHPGGIIVIPRDKEIYDFTPVQHPAEKENSDTITTHFDYHFLHDNILKLDILGHEGPAMLKLLEEYTGINSLTVDINDSKMLSLFNSSDALELNNELLKKPIPLGTLGIPEMGTGFVTKMLMETRPSTISELVRISGLSHGTDVWNGNAQTLISEGTCTLSQAICCRDDIMLYLINKNLEKKMSFDIMEAVRKGKGLKPEWEAAMREHDVPEWYIDSCKKIKYMFPKAHAVAYVTLSLRIAWYKLYEPVAYYAARFSMKIDDFDGASMIHGLDRMYGRMAVLNLINSDIDDIDAEESGDDSGETSAKKGEMSAKDKAQAALYNLLVEMYARGIEFLPVDIYKSDATFFKPENGKIRPPIAAFQGVGGAAAMNIVTERDKRIEKGDTFLSIEDLQLSAGVNKAVLETLKSEGCFDGWPDTNQMSLFDMF